MAENVILGVTGEDKRMNELLSGFPDRIIGIDIEGNSVQVPGREFLKEFAYAERKVDIDFNNLLPGEYYVSGNLSNAPSSEDWFVVKVIGTGDLLQFAMSITSDTLWKRTKMNNSWRAWKSIVFTS